MSRTDMTLNQTLTNYAFGLSQDVRSAVADFIAPPTPVGTSIGKFKSFNTKNAFVLYDTARALGGPATRVKLAADDTDFNCTPQALEIAVDDAERGTEGDDLGIEQARVRTLIVLGAVSHEHKVMTAAKAGIAAVAGKGVWSGANIDPIDEIDEQIEALAIAMGAMPNRMLLGVAAFRILRNNPKVRARFPGAASVGVTREQLASLLLNSEIEIKVGSLSYDTAKLGATKSAANVVGSECFIFAGQANSTPFDPSMMKTFMVKSGSVSAVWQYREPRGDVLSVDWSEDIQVTGSACGKRITVS